MVQREHKRLFGLICLLLYSTLFRYFELVGVVSYGVGCNSTINGETRGSIFNITNQLTDSKIPGVYSRVSVAVDWIMAHAVEGRFCPRPGGKESTSAKYSSG